LKMDNQYNDQIKIKKRKKKTNTIIVYQILHRLLKIEQHEHQ
jgi:hypothetical protein